MKIKINSSFDFMQLVRIIFVSAFVALMFPFIFGLLMALIVNIGFNILDIFKPSISLNVFEILAYLFLSLFTVLVVSSWCFYLNIIERIENIEKNSILRMILTILSILLFLFAFYLYVAVFNIIGHPDIFRPLAEAVFMEKLPQYLMSLVLTLWVIPVCILMIIRREKLGRFYKMILKRIIPFRVRFK